MVALPRYPWPFAFAGVVCVFLVACASSGKKPQHAIPAYTLPATQPLVAAAKAPVSGVLQHAGANPELLLNRISWGANASSSQLIMKTGMDAYLYQQLHARSAILPQDVQSQIDAMSISQRPFDQMIFDLEQRRTEAAQQKGTDDSLRKAYQQELNRLAHEAASRSLLRAVYSPSQLLEQMDWFWMNHFNLHNGKHNLRAMSGDFDEQAIRPHALGNFRDLLRATAQHPAMLRYLDNEHNAVNRINENYARELLELHTMGVGSGYSQHDVQELARVLTGVGINLGKQPPRLRPELQRSYVRKGLFEFNPQRHDFGDKQILGKTIRGRGLGELDEVLMQLCRQPATARFISRKLALYFVSDGPSDALVNSMAHAFLQSDGDIPSVLRTMFDSPEFVASLGGKFKDPLHYVVSSIRLAYDGVTLLNTAPMLNWLNQMGEPLNGHQTPDGYSLLESSWASPAQMTTRFDIAKTIASGSPALFRPENQEMRVRSQDLPRPALINSDYGKTWERRLSLTTQQTISQGVTPQERNTLFLSSPELMRR